MIGTLPLSRKIEFLCGASAAVLGIVAFADVFLRDVTQHNRLGEIFHLNSGYVFEFFMLAFPSLIVAMAAYAHAVKYKTWGFILLLVGGLLTNALLLAYAPGILWLLAIFNDIFGLLVMVVEFVLVMVTIAAAVAAFMRRDPFGTAL